MKEKSKKRGSVAVMGNMAYSESKVDRILLVDSTGSHSSMLHCFSFSCENNLSLITSWISSAALMTSQRLSGLLLCTSVIVCVCVCAQLRKALSSEVFD